MSTTPPLFTQSRSMKPSAPRQSYDRVASVVAQLEFYFSEKNLARDEYLRGLLEQKGAWVVRRCIPRA